MASILLCFLVSALALISSPPPALSQNLPPIVNGLSFTFYKSSCPNLDSIVRGFLKKEFKKNIGLAAALLRVHFHDCFVQGCDASVLLDGSASGPSEQEAPPNLTLRPEAFKAINDLRALIDRKCGRVVSCADVVALAARDSVFLSHSARRDGLKSHTRNFTARQHSPPRPQRLVILTHPLLRIISIAYRTPRRPHHGGHTIGAAATAPPLTTASSSSVDPTMDPNLLQKPPPHLPFFLTHPTTPPVLDIRSPTSSTTSTVRGSMNSRGFFTPTQEFVLWIPGRSRGGGIDFAAGISRFSLKDLGFRWEDGAAGRADGWEREIRSTVREECGEISMLARWGRKETSAAY
ncbi:Peroxidase 12 [Dendrobium catenatum]|uniref:Peroxidase n=1 Tax=Dendrobium catenatum TaxID=906689 RepID=A0A2I0VJ86_9ASPA|nr:Peroxidase 12 [Dendrobium catenatum]